MHGTIFVYSISTSKSISFLRTQESALCTACKIYEGIIDMKFSKAVVKFRKLILVVSVLLMVPSAIGYLNTRVNYDMLTYLPPEMDTTIGQEEMMNDFGKGAYALIVAEDMNRRDLAKLQTKLEQINHVSTVIGYGTIKDGESPKELLPKELSEKFVTDNASLIAVFLDASTSADVTMDAIREMRKVCGEQCYISSLSAMVTDLKDLCEQEEPIYVAIAVVLSLLTMMALLDSFLAPVVFLISIGMMIIINLGSNIMFGEISYITKALSAVLQLAVTMDYSIFLWNSYNEQLAKRENNLEAMEYAISETVTSVIGSSITTVAGFIALCFMSFTLGKDLGLVMAKGVVFGVIGCVTVLPSLILIFDKPLQKTKHKALIPDMGGASDFITKHNLVFVLMFVAALYPALYSYNKAKEEVYFNLQATMPQDMDFAVANRKLTEDFDIACTHIVMVSADTPSSKVKRMSDEMSKVDGVMYAVGLDAIAGGKIPTQIIPQQLRNELVSDKWQMILINSSYAVATDEVNTQIDNLNSILKEYDPDGMLIGEAPCMKDMIEVTNKDFRIVNVVSIGLVFLIIALVEKSITLPFILIAVIELATFINLGIPHWLGQSMPFIAPTCVSTIQLGATVDYAILTTTRYKQERNLGKDRKKAVADALRFSVPSVLVSGFGLFMATFGVAIYSDIDIIKSICMLIARGALISMACVIFILPAMLILFDYVIIHTTFGMKNLKKQTD